MKKRIAVLIAASIIASVGIAAAAGGYQTIRVYMDQIPVAINTHLSVSEQQAMIYEGAIFVPLRRISELLGAEVVWDAQNRSVNIDTVNVNLMNDLRNSHSLAVYQFLSVEKNIVLKSMEKSLTGGDLQGLEEVVSEFGRLADIAENLENAEIGELLQKMASAVELMRSGLASDNFDDYYFAWDLFENSANRLNAILKTMLED